MARLLHTPQLVADAARLTGDGLYAVSADGVDVVLVRVGGTLRAFEGRCPHQGALLGEGELDGDVIVCRNHRWRFRADSGARQGGPQVLRACPVVERRGQVFADVSVLADDSDRPAGSAARSIANLPGPRGLPLAGNLLQLRTATLHEVVERWARRYGSLYVFRLGPRQVVVVADPRLAVQVLRARPEVYKRVRTIGSAFDGMGIAGVFSAEGSAWRPQRRLAMEALSQRHLRGFFPAVQMVAERLLGRLRRAADRGDVVDIVEELKRFTVDVTTLLTFGHDVNTIEHEGADIIQRQLETVFPVLTARVFAAVPLWRIIRLPRDRRFDRAIADLRLWLAGPVQAARDRLAAAPEFVPANFLEAMLVARDDSGQPFSDQMIFGNLMNMLLAGEDTTAYTLAWAVHQLCDSPPTVTALRDELGRELGPDPVPRTFENTDRPAYAGAVANEAMRLRPVAPLIFMENIAETALDDVRLPAGTPVLVATRPPVLDPGSFDDPASFRAERWLTGSAGLHHDPSSHFPFGSGPRVCPGRSLALLEMKLVLATLYKNFDITRDGHSAEVQEIFSFTMHPRGLKVRLRRRS